MGRTNAITKELTRVRQLKRNVESMVEFLHSEMEAGRIHLRVNPDLQFRKYLLTDGTFDYVDPVSGLFAKSKESWRFVLVDQLFTPDGEIKDEIVIEVKL